MAFASDLKAQIRSKSHSQCRSQACPQIVAVILRRLGMPEVESGQSLGCGWAVGKGGSKTIQAFQAWMLGETPEAVCCIHFV